MKTLGERFKFIRGTESQDSFAKFLGVSRGTVSLYERDEGQPSAEVLLKIWAERAISPTWVLTGHGPMQIDEVKPSLPDSASYSQPPVVPDSFALVPLVTARLSAGCGCDLTSAKVEKLYSFRLDFLQRKGNPKDMVLMRVSGRSMEPEIWDGDIALLDTAKKSIAHEKILAVRYEDDIYIKRIEKMPNGVTLRSVNPEYAPAFVELNECTTDNFEVLGRVIWIGREYR